MFPSEPENSAPRKRPGATPKARWNACVNELRLGYPVWTPIALIGSVVDRNSRAASLRRIEARNSIGARPKLARKAPAKAERLIPTRAPRLERVCGSEN